MKEYIKGNKMLISITIIFSLLSSIATVLVSKVYEMFFDIVASGDINEFKKLVIFSIGYIFLIAFLFYSYKIASKILIRNVLESIRNRVFKGVMRRNYKDFTEINTGDYISSLTNDVNSVEENYIRPFLAICQNIGIFIVTVIMLLYYSVVITVVIFISSALMFIIPSLLGKILAKKQYILSKEFTNFTGKIKDIFSGFDVIRSYNLLNYMNNVFIKQNGILAKKKYEVDKIKVLNDIVSQTLGITVQIGTSCLCAYMVISGDLTIGMLAAVLQLCGNFVNPLMGIMNNIPLIKSMKPILKKLYDISNYRNEDLIGSLKPSFDKNIIVKDLEFSYDGKNKIIDGINLEINKNKKYAIVGGSGSGKSTLIKLILGYYGNFKGSIMFDNEGLNNIDINELNKMTSIIHQGVYMFDDTIKNNICLYNDYSDEEIDRTIERSCVDKIIRGNEITLENTVGENGSNLSGGQKQRIAIARALIKNTPILVLDEGTSAVDMQTGYDIEQSLLKIDDLTLITITHKMSSELLENYDEIIFMENGRIGEIGSFNELLDKKDKFYKFFTLDEENTEGILKCEA